MKSFEDLAVEFLSLDDFKNSDLEEFYRKNGFTDALLTCTTDAVMDGVDGMDGKNDSTNAPTRTKTTKPVTIRSRFEQLLLTFTRIKLMVHYYTQKHPNHASIISQKLHCFYALEACSAGISRWDSQLDCLGVLKELVGTDSSDLSDHSLASSIDFPKSISIIQLNPVPVKDFIIINYPNNDQYFQKHPLFLKNLLGCDI
jgi:hypothetical protein